MKALRVGVRARRVFAWRQFALLFSSRSRRVLLVTGEYSQNGSSRYLDCICDTLRRHGYEIYAVQYIPDRGQISRFWDKEFYIKRLAHGKGGQGAGFTEKDIGSALPEFLRNLTHRLDFDIVVANYVFLSWVLVDIDPNLFKMIITHDAFTNRKNMSDDISNTGIPLRAQQESMGLSRADLVVAITDDDRHYFVEQLNQAEVITLPFIPRFCPTRPRGGSGKKSAIIVGYLGSAHWPNVDAVRTFIAAGDDSVGFSLLVGGKVCDSLRDIALPPYVQLLGRQLSLKRFYDRCHLIVNPDSFRSGQKIKTVEALAYGMPLICTLTAASGLPSTSRYHQAESAEACFRLVEEVARHPECLGSLRQESITLYWRLYERYLEDIDGGFIGAIDRARAVKSGSDLRFQ